MTGDHQTKNAKSLVDAGAALIIPEPELDGQTLIAAADQLLLDTSTSDKMAAQATKVGMPDAGDRLYQLLLSAISEKKD